MPELRQNPATKEWVIIATERAKRPEDFTVMEQEEGVKPKYDPHCPFCPGNEDSTPPEILSYKNGKGDWTLRVVPNKFAALVPEGSAEREKDSNFFRSMQGLGKHEVIIENKYHNVSFGEISDRKAAEIIKAYHERYLALSEDGRFKLIKIFRNSGIRAGTSLEHPHSQIVATPVVPLHIRHRLEEAVRYYDDNGHCVFCKIIEMEKKEGDRIILATDDFVALVPFAARVPFETWILPVRHNSSFGDITASERSGLASMMNKVLEKMIKGLNRPSYNMVIRTVPTGDEKEEYYHWYIQIIPRLTTPAGFELGTGVYINTSLPEETARFLRKA